MSHPALSRSRNGSSTMRDDSFQLAPAGETKAQRKKRERESQVWERSVKQI
jgi:hypothetical protein